MIERAEESPVEDDSQETVTAPLSMLGGQTVQPGDVVRLKVVSVDDTNGTFDAAYDHPKKESGISEMASKFDEGDELA
jgi:hypothetical protein